VFARKVAKFAKPKLLMLMFCRQNWWYNI